MATPAQSPEPDTGDDTQVADQAAPAAQQPLGKPLPAAPAPAAAPAVEEEQDGDAPKDDIMDSIFGSAYKDMMNKQQGAGKERRTVPLHPYSPVRARWGGWGGCGPAAGIGTQCHTCARGGGHPMPPGAPRPASNAGTDPSSPLLLP